MGLTHSLTQIIKNPNLGLADGGSGTTGMVAMRAALVAVGAGTEGTCGSVVSVGGAAGATLGQAQPVKKRRGPVECCWGERQCPNCPRRGG
jgi:hypothetical protein